MEYRIPTTPRAAPDTHVQIIFASAFIARATTPAQSQAIVPIAINVTTDFMEDLSEVMKAA
jgi:hypothetical protein